MMDTRINNTFDAVRNECTRSTTHRNLHPVKENEEVLARLLKKASNDYSENIASQFQNSHEKINPSLSFLFAQVSNAVFEKSFHNGSCHAQAAYSLIELAKKEIFNASLMWSKTNNISTEHFYLLMLDEGTLKILKQLKTPNPVCALVNFKTGLPPESLFFDTWSNELCEYKKLNHNKNAYIKEIKLTDQVLFRPLIHLFENKIKIIENIIWCLNEYEARLNKLTLAKGTIPEYIAKLFTATDIAFQDEISLLFDPSQCISKLLKNIENYKKDFQAQLDLFNQGHRISAKEEIEKKDTKLSTVTHDFFNKQLAWKLYPTDKLVGKYVGHQVRFFTMQQEDIQTKANEFVSYLNKGGFNAELKSANNKPSILVDLTTSTFKL
jgi:hypothetical protein